ncbi:hypothetical protein OFC58_34745, partial [Escherichia coli]|nr:hypothetical protein [Escherichia coli]
MLISLFIAGVIHLIGRLRDALDRFTYSPDEIHESILDDAERKIKPVSRPAATAFLILGIILSFSAGMLIGSYVDFS